MQGMCRRSIHIDRYVSAAARILAACLVLVAMVAVPAAAQNRGNVVPLTAGEVVPGQYIVVLNDTVANPRAAARALARSHGFELRLVYGAALRGFAAAIPERALPALRRDPRVKFIEADQTVQAFAQGVPTGVRRIYADDNLSIGIDGNDDWRVDVDVAILDGGIADHADLNIAGRTNCASGSPFNQSCADNDGTGGNGHGTHVAGTVGAIDNEFGVVGVAPGARLWSVKVLKDNGSGWMSWIIAGVDWTVAHGGIEVANMSLGGGNSDALCAAVNSAVDNGITVVVSAGNSDANAANYSPGNCAGSITVSALADFNGDPGGGAAPTCYTDEDDTLANYSNWGAVDIIAPGSCIVSTWTDGLYAQISGTSMASPHAAGAAALLASNDLGPAAIRTALLNSGSDDWNTVDDPDGTQEPLLDVTGFSPTMVAGGGVVIPPADAAPDVAWMDPTDGGNVAISTTVPIQIDAQDAEDAAGSLIVEWQVDGVGDWFAANWNSVSGYYESTWVTSGMADGSSHTLMARAEDSYFNLPTTSANVTVGTAPPPTTTMVSLETLTCTMTGGKNSDKHLSFHLIATDIDGGVAGATVSVQVANSSTTRNGTGTTDEFGQIGFSWKNAPNDTYVLTVNSVAGTDIEWDTEQPIPNSCTKPVL